MGYLKPDYIKTIVKLDADMLAGHRRKKPLYCECFVQTNNTHAFFRLLLLFHVVPLVKLYTLPLRIKSHSDPLVSLVPYMHYKSILNLSKL